jgi:phenylalanyl-tRNA synthetase beta chain
MLVSYRWLQDFVATTTDPEELGYHFLMTSSELERVLHYQALLENFVTAKVLSCTAHPQADRLHVTEVEVGKKKYLIVTADLTVKSGDVVVLALPGAEVTHEKGEKMRIETASLRGVTSEGMMCGVDQVPLPFISEQTGVWKLPADTPSGLPLAEFLGIDDTVLDLEITPNRPDLLSHVGLAREVACFESKSLHHPQISDITPARTPTSPQLAIHIEPHAPCTRLSMVPLRVHTQGPSPLWMQARLILAGMRPVNGIVDVTNYIMLELGQPLHAYNLSQVKQQHPGKLHFRAEKVSVRTTMKTLDGIERVLEAGDGIISINGEPADLAGIMGGLESSIQPDTTEILLEAATFSGPQVRRTSHRLGLRTEASTRFEKGLDSELTTIALARAVYLLESLGIAERSGPLLDHRIVQKVATPAIRFSTQQFESLIGLPINIVQAKHILERLGFRITHTSKTSFQCTPPTWRGDIKLEEDVVEEVLRIWGYNRVPSTLPQGEIKPPQPNLRFHYVSAMTERAVERGFQEVVNIPFTSKRYLEIAGIKEAVAIENPISQEQTHLAPSHLITFLPLVAASQQQEESRLFEVGTIFSPPHNERSVASALLRGNHAEDLFREAKRLIEAMVPQSHCTYSASTHLIAGLAAGTIYTVQVEGKTIATLGVVKPEVVAGFKIRRGRSIVFVEMDLAALMVINQVPLRYQAPLTFPSIQRDITLTVDEDIAWESVEKVLKEHLNKELRLWSLTSVFRSKEKGDHKKSLTIHFTYQSAARTLTDEEVDQHQTNLIAALRKQINATIL